MTLDSTKIINILSIAVPELDEILAYLEKNKGWINLDENLISLILKWDLNWHTYYEDEQRLRTLSALMFFDAEKLKELLDIK